MFTALDQYIARLIFTPFLATMLISAMLLLLDKMLRLFDFVVNEGGPVSVVWQLLANTVPEYLSLGIPIGLLLGIMLAFRKLAANSELDAILGTGQSYIRLLKVPMLFALILAAANVGVVGYLAPLSRYAYEGLHFELRSGALGATIKVGEFASLGDNVTLRIDEARQKGKELRGVFASTSDKSGRLITATARSGEFLKTDDPDIILFRLRDGTLALTGGTLASPRLLDFGVHDMPIKLPDSPAFRARGGEELELTLDELLSRVEQTRIDPMLNRIFDSNLQRRLIQPTILLVLPFLALGLAIPAKRSGTALGVFLGVVGLVTYNKVSEFAERAGAQGDLPVLAAQWLPFTIFAVTSIWLFCLLAFRPGPPPLDVIDRQFNKASKALAKMLSVRRMQRFQKA